MGTIPVTPVGAPMPVGPYSGQGPAGGPSIGKSSGGVATVSPYYQGLSAQFANWLQTYIGSGAKPFDMSQTMPSSGNATSPGQLSAPMTDLLAGLQDFLKTGNNPSGAPGLNSLKDLSETGSRVTALPEWKTALEAMKANTGRQNANLRENFAGAGTLNSSPYALAAADFAEQTTRDQNALLATNERQALESAQGRRLDSSKFLFEGGMQLGQIFQGMDQAAIDRTLQEFIRTRPEYSPLLLMLQQLTTMFGPTVGKTQSKSILDSIISAAPAIIGAL